MENIELSQCVLVGMFSEMKLFNNPPYTRRRPHIQVFMGTSWDVHGNLKMENVAAKSATMPETTYSKWLHQN